METTLIIRGRPFGVKYENGIVSVRPPESIAWVSGQTEPNHNLTENEIGEFAQEIVRGLGL